MVDVLSFEDDLCDGVLGRVRDGEVCGRRAGVLEERARLSVKAKRRRARLICDNFHVLPREAAAPARAERLQRRFFRGEARGIMLRSGDGAAPFAVGALCGSEHARDEARRACDSGAYASDFDDVNADGDDHRR